MKQRYALIISLFVSANSLAQNVGVDVAVPQQKLDVAGGIRIGTTSNALLGSLRMNGTVLEYHNGTGWIQMSANTDDQQIDVFGLSGNTLELSIESDGQATQTVDLSAYLDNTDNQQIDFFNLNADVLSISLEDDGQPAQTVNLASYLDNTDDQQIDVFGLSGNTLELSIESDGQATQTVDLSGYLDNTDDQQISTFSISSNTLTLELENDGQPAQSVNLAPYLDNTDDQTVDEFSLTGTDLNLSLESDGQTTLQVDLDPLRRLLLDEDADTKIEVEATPDEDVIRFSTAATEQMRILTNGKIGIGTTTPGTRLTVYGTGSDTEPVLSVTGGNQQGTFNDGAQIAFGFDGDNEYQHFIHTRHNQIGAANNSIDFYVNNGTTANNTVTTGSTHVMSLNAGNVGVGTDAPAQKLEVVGTARISSLASANQLVISNAQGDLVNSSSLVGTGMGDNLGNHTATTMLNMAGYDIDFGSGNSGQIRSVGTISFDWTAGTYDSSPNHGIESKDESGNLSDDIRINSYDNITNTLDANNNSGTSYFKVQQHSVANGSDLFWVRSSDGFGYFLGNVGLGTTTPAEKLHVNGNIRGNQSGAVRISTGSGYIDVGPKNTGWAHFYTDRPRYYFDKGLTVDGGLIGSYDENLSIQTSGTTRITVKNTDGNVGIGTTNPIAKLDVRPAGGAAAFQVLNSGNDYPRIYMGGNSSSVAFVINRLTTSATQYFGEDSDTGGFDFRGTGSTRIGSLSGSGNRLVMANASGVLSASNSLVGTGLGDNLGNHTATTNLNMVDNHIYDVNDLEVNRIFDGDGSDNIEVHDHLMMRDNMNLRLGNSSDFRMWHNGSHHYFRDYNHGGGNIYFQGEDSGGTNEALLYMYTNGSRGYVSLYENGAERLQTTSTGIQLNNVMDIRALPSGDYGSIQVDSEGKGNWEGYSINGRFVYMSDNNSHFGLYDDIENDWVIYWDRDQSLRFYEPNGSGDYIQVQNGAHLNMRDNHIYDANDVQANRIYDPEDSELQVVDDLQMLSNDIWAVNDMTVQTIYDNGGDIIHFDQQNSNAFTVRFDVGSSRDIWFERYDSNHPHIRPGTAGYGFIGRVQNYWGWMYTQRMYRTNEYGLSDRRVKENIRNLDSKSSLDKILQLQGTKFDLNKQTHPFIGVIETDQQEKDTKDNLGFIAQDLMEVIPEMVVLDEETGYYMIKNYEQLFPIVIEAMKEQQSQINELKRTVEALRSSRD